MTALSTITAAGDDLYGPASAERRTCALQLGEAAASAHDATGEVASLDTRRHLTEDLPEAVATAVFEFITGPLLENPPCVGKQLRPPRTVTVLAIG